MDALPAAYGWSESVVAEGLLEAEPGEEHHQHHHEDDRDVVRLHEDVDELPEGLHVRSVPRALRAVNVAFRLLARAQPFALRALRFERPVPGNCSPP